MNNVVVIGSINVDLVTQTPRMPQPGETLFGKSFSTMGGGKGANQVVACARLGADASMIGRVADDDFGKMMRSSLTKAGVNCEGIAVSENTNTGIAIITVDDNGENSIIVISGANMILNPSDVLANESIIKNADIAIAQLEIPQDAVKKAFSIAKANGVTTVLNPAPAKPLDDELISLVDILVPNETELEILSGMKITNEESIKDAANKLINLGVKQIIVTLGSKGSIAIGFDGEIIRQNSYKVDAIDTTAAGDCFIGGLCAALSRGASLKEAMDFASRASAIAVTVFGAQNSIPTKEMVDKFEI